MVCDYTFRCPRRLFSSPIGSWLSYPQRQEAATLSLFQLPWVYKQVHSCQNHQSHLCCCLDNTSPRPAFTSTSGATSGCSIPDLKSLFLCCFAHVHQEDCRLFTRKSTHSQERARKCTIDSSSQVNSLSRTCSQMHHWLSLASHLSADFIPFRKARHCGTVLSSWHSHPALVSLILPSGATHPAGQDTHSICSDTA